jgi:UDP-N-acetylglucosamine 2-epimerase (non-hydrolysing)
MKVMVIAGTRPEIIKLAPVIFAAKASDHIETIVCATGQHREMQKQAFATFNIVPDIDLDVMGANQTLAQLTENAMREITKALKTYQPDWVLVQGDTTSAFVGGLAAFYQHIKVGHVEAGLRTYNLQSPFPEELNRQLLTKLASLNFPPTSLSAENLLRELVPAENILITGNTVVDAINYMVNRWQGTPPLIPDAVASLLADPARKLVLVTCHRRESFGEPLMNICRALQQLCQQYADYTWVYPVHLNPNVKEVVMRELQHIPNLHLIAPLDYEATLYVMSRASLVLTDSGGIQEEAASFAVPTVVMRNHTERQEGVDAGFATLVGTDLNAIVKAASYYLDSLTIREELAHKPNPYGDGKASQRIVDALS